jgi:hypothetical protein
MNEQINLHGLHYSPIVTSASVYGKEILDKGVPEGFSLVGFRAPQPGEYILTTNGIAVVFEGEPSVLKPFIILRTLAKRNVYSFTETGENRPLKAGEWGWDGFVMLNNDSTVFNANKSYRVYKMVKSYVWE